MKKIIISFLLVFGISTQALAWGDIGHGAIGEIAERNLTDQGKKFVRSILGVEPLPISASWPDHVRSDARFKAFSPYHYVDFPYIYKSYVDAPFAARAEKNGDTIISNAENVLVSNKYSREQKMIFLRYLVHVVGDIHMPLHVGNGQDMGANLCDVYLPNPNIPNQSSISNLHSVWDEKLIDFIGHDYKQEKGGKAWFGYLEFADIVIRDTQNIKSSIGNLGLPNDWYSESRNLHNLVYPDGISTAPDRRPYCKFFDEKLGTVVNGAYDKNKLVHLNRKYIDRSLPIIKKQILLGGLRLAQMINKIADESGTINAPDESEILNGILLKNPSGRSLSPQMEQFEFDFTF